MTKAEAQLETYVNNFPLYAGDCLQIKSHDTQQIIPLELNNGQRILHNIAAKCKKSFGFVRILFLKSRRFGGSTYVQARGYRRASLLPNQSIFIVGHEEESTKTLYQMAQLMHEQNPLQPATKKSNAQELVFDNTQGTGLKSQYRLATARNVDAGRSQGINFLHLSEEGYYNDGETLLTGLLQCVPDPPSDHEIYRESTANGYGNTFQQDAFRAYNGGQNVFYSENGIDYAWKQPGNDWVVVFIPWFAVERYSKEFDDDQHRKEFEAKIAQEVYNQEFQRWEKSEAYKLREKFHLTLQQVHWWTWAIENKCRGSIDKMHQEYPSTFEEAFLSAGTSVYSASLCDEAEQFCAEPILKGELTERNGRVKIRPTPHGQLQIWEHPLALSTKHCENDEFFITVDTGGGKRDLGEADETHPDPTCIDVWNLDTGAQAAQWHGHMDYDEIDEIIYMIAVLYARKDELPISCIEQNNHGWAVLKGCKAKNLPLYEWKSGDPGWRTDKVTKPQMVNDLRDVVKNGRLTIRSKETISEMRTYQERAGKFGAESSCHDDRVITAALGGQMLAMLPRRDKYSRETEDGITNWQNHLNPKKDDYQEVSVG